MKIDLNRLRDMVRQRNIIGEARRLSNTKVLKAKNRKTDCEIHLKNISEVRGVSPESLQEAGDSLKAARIILAEAEAERDRIEENFTNIARLADRGVELARRNGCLPQDIEESLP